MIYIWSLFSFSFSLGQTMVTAKWADQLTDGIEVKFSKAVHLRNIQFLGKVQSGKNAIYNIPVLVFDALLFK